MNNWTIIILLVIISMELLHVFIEARAIRLQFHEYLKMVTEAKHKSEDSTG